MRPQIFHMDREEALRLLEDFFAEDYDDRVREAERSGEDSVFVEHDDLDQFDPELMDYIFRNPEEGLEAAKEATTAVELVDEELKVRIRDMDEEDYVLLKNLRSKHIGKFVPIEGMIKRASQVKPEVESAVFECTNCGNEYEKEQDSAQLKSPYKCQNCGSKKFRPVEKKMVDTQVVTLEENPESREGSEQPSSLSVRLEGDLVDPEFQKKVVPGNVVEVTGIVRDRPIKKSSKKFDIYMEANNVEPLQQEFEQLELEQDEIREIKELSDQDDIFDQITSSIAPSIYGHDKIKEAIALQLFGGVRKTREDGVKSRGDLHILLIGEPGTGKSQLLKFAGEMAPKGRYVVGKSSTGAGLTASVVKEESTGEFSLEAGAVVLAHKGMAAIDEIDKMSSEDRSSLHEAMEQQCFAPETRVTMADGRTRRIKDIVDQKLRENEARTQEDGREVAEASLNVLSLNTETNKVEEAEVSLAGKREAPDRTLSFELGNGREIEVTPEHPLYTVRDGEIKAVEASELGEDDYLVAPREIPVEGEEQGLEEIEVEERRKDVSTPDHNSPELARFTGYQLSDGGYELNRGRKNGFNFTNTEETLIEDYRGLVNDLFGVEPFVRERGNRKEIRVISEELKDWLQELGPVLKKGPQKKMPGKLMKCRKEDLSHLLKAFFDGDGGVYQVERGYRIRAVTENRELLEQIQSVLLRFGIHSTLIEDGNVWRIEINRYSDLKKFKQHIGFNHPEKQRKLREATSKRGSNETVPGLTSRLMDLERDLGIKTKEVEGHNLLEDSKVTREKAFRHLEALEERMEKLKETELEDEVEELRKIRRRFGVSGAEIADEIGVSHSLISHWELNGTERTEEYREGLKSVLDRRKRLEKDLEEIHAVLENTRFVRIREIEEKRPEYDYVYDLTVPENHNFVAENVFVHNSISVNKANIQATLNAQTSILAAGNPKLGRFDPYEPIPEQINIGDTLLSRFDFIFPVKDEPDEERDQELAGQILSNHREPEEQDPDLSQETLRKYVAYAKKNVRPDLSEEASDIIKEFYVSMRASGDEDSVPITARQLEAMVRIAEASAKAHLRDEVVEEDAERAVDLLQYTLEQVGMDPETGDFDIDRIESGVSSSQRNRIQTIKHIIDQASGDDDAAEIEEVIEMAESEDIKPEKTEEVIEKLKREGELFEPKQGFVQKI